MRIPIPKNLGGYQCERLFSVELNDFDVEMLLPALFYYIRSKGQDRGKPDPSNKVDKSAVEKYINKLHAHSNIHGFEGVEGQRLLGRWVRTSLIATGRLGRARVGEQILFVKPLTFLSYKPGFPTEARRLRGVHRFLLKVLRQYFSEEHSDAPPYQTISAVFGDAFSRGILSEEGADLPGKYDGVTLLDTESLLSVYFLEGFPSSPPKRGRPVRLFAPSCQNAARIMAEDISLFMAVYHKRIPVRILSFYLMALINFELFIYSLKLIRAVNSFLESSLLPKELGGSGDNVPLEIYIDVTEQRGSPSDHLAMRCVNRDLEALQRYFRNSLIIRTLDRYIKSSSRLEQMAPDRTSPSYLEHVLQFRDSSDLDPWVSRDLEEIEDYWKDTNLKIPESLHDKLSSADSDFLRLMTTLWEAQESTALQAYVKWFWYVGGLTKPYGILRGNLKGRRIWRYALSDIVLETLVQLYAVSERKYLWKKIGTETTLEQLSPVYQEGADIKDLSPEPFSLRNFLSFLRDRYGLLIDRPAKDMADAETLAASSVNLQALKDRLRNMGLFQDLSDDFTAQVVTPHYREIRNEKV